MYAELKRSGELEEAIRQADEQTADAVLKLVELGVDFWKTWEMMREESGRSFLPRRTRTTTTRGPSNPSQDELSGLYEASPVPRLHRRRCAVRPIVANGRGQPPSSSGVNGKAG